MKVAVTGHRPHKLDNDYEGTGLLAQHLRAEIFTTLMEIASNNGKDIRDLELISGMALGVDTIFANIAVENDFDLIAAIPFIGQYSKWQAKSVAHYNSLLMQAKTIRVVDYDMDMTYDEYYTMAMEMVHSGAIACQYSAAKMQLRNQWMVDNADVLIAVWDGSAGGTANCVKYAESVGKRIITINPNHIRATLLPNGNVTI